MRVAVPLAAAAVTVSLSGCGTPLDSLFQNCVSDLTLPSVVKPEAKGLCIDDTTFQGCMEKIPTQWPHTDSPVSSLRLFKAWGADWPVENREKAWDLLVAHVKHNNVKVLLATQVTCDPWQDDQDWDGVQQLLKRLGPEHVMGLAVGNEMELCLNNYDKACCEQIWLPSEEYPHGYYSELFAKRASQLDAIEGFNQTKMTAVMGGAVLSGPGSPFLETANCDGGLCGRVSSFVKDALTLLKDRFVFSMNIYAYFDPNAKMDADGKTCSEQLAKSLCFEDEDCYMATLVGVMRDRMQQARGDSDGLLWVGETGWSAPKAETLSSAVQKCDDWSSAMSFQRSYENFASWDLSIPNMKGPDHVFYFTLRDSNNFGDAEGFGLMSSCHHDICKLSGSGQLTISLNATSFLSV